MVDPARSTLAVTETDIARSLGVSRATVSRAMHGRGRISEETRNRVRAAADALGYVPNTNAIRLASRHNDTLGLLLRDSRNPAYSALLSALQLEAQKRQHEIVTVTVSADDDGHNQLAGLRRLLGIRVAGLLIATGDISSERLRPFQHDVPILRAGRPEPDTGVNAISYDEIAHARLLGGHILGLGHRDIAVIVTDREVSYPEWIRGTEIAAFLRDHGATVTEFPVHDPTDGINAALDAAEAGTVTAVMLPTDARLLDAMRAARSRGLRIPADVSLTGCDGLFPGSDLLGLTTVRLPVEGLAETVMTRMLTLIQTPDSSIEQRSVAGTLIPGATAGPVTARADRTGPV